MREACRLTAGPSIFAVVLAVGAHAQAASLPAALFNEYVQWNNRVSYDDPDGTAPGLITAADSESRTIEHTYFVDNETRITTTTVTTGFDGAAGTTGGGRPSAVARISVGGDGSGAAIGNVVHTGGTFASASARIEYHVGVFADASLGRIFNSSSVRIPLKVFATVGAAADVTGERIVATGPYATAGASMRISSQTLFDLSDINAQGVPEVIRGLLQFTFGANAKDEHFGAPGLSTTGGASRTYDLTIPVAPNARETLKVTLQAGATAQAYGGAYGNGRSASSGAVASALADPVFVVDPDWAYADLVSLSYSPLITQGAMPSAVPLPPSALMLGGAVASGALLRRRGGRRAQEAGR